jgi:hypothetical protein
MLQALTCLLKQIFLQLQIAILSFQYMNAYKGITLFAARRSVQCFKM